MKTPLPRLDDFTNYVAARQRHDALKKQHRQKLARRAEIDAKLEERRGQMRSRIADAARKLVFGEEEQSGFLTHAELTELGTLVDELRVLEHALKLSFDMLQTARSAASREACRMAAGEHAKIARRIAEAAKALALACEAETNFRAELERAGIETGTLPFVRVGDLGRIDDRHSQIGWHLLELFARGTITLDELPKALHQATVKRPPPEPVPLSVRSPRTKILNLTQPADHASPVAVRIS